MQIIWSDEAVADFHQNINYLLENWPTSVATEFIEDVEAVVELIKSHPDLYPLSDYKEIRRAVIRKQVTLFFKIEKDAIHLIRFWNNYQSPQKLKL
jgi:plasmid stabilization system protein ParE